MREVENFRNQENNKQARRGNGDNEFGDGTIYRAPGSANWLLDFFAIFAYYTRSRWIRHLKLGSLRTGVYGVFCHASGNGASTLPGNPLEISPTRWNPTSYLVIYEEHVMLLH
jgi:hypothetical protein